MYLPNYFEITDRAAIQRFIHENGFAALVTHHDGQLTASHLPFIYDAAVGEHGCLRAHWARNNPQWNMCDGEAMVIFSGPHTYISSRWYERNDGVPTWNYTVLHAYGQVTIIQDPDELIALAYALVEQYEPALLEIINDAKYRDALRKRVAGIVGLSIEVTRLETKFKMSQNRSVSDRKRVIAALRSERTDEQSLAVAQLMEELLGKQ
jgi:transcriptional regulator